GGLDGQCRRSDGQQGEEIRAKHEYSCHNQRGEPSEITTASASPSYPFAPTVWMAVALTRRSAASISLNRRTPCTPGSRLAGSITDPSRTTLSAMISVPRRESRSDHAR